MKPIMRLLELLTLKCDGATALVSRALDEPLGVGERVALLGHLLACAPCRRFRRQIALLRDALRLGGERGGAAATVGDGDALSADAKARIAAAVKRSLDAQGQ